MRLAVTLASMMLAIGFHATNLCGQSEFDGPPIRYSSRETTDRIAKLKLQIESGNSALEWSDQHGWLPAILNVFDVPQSSQTLVFSKTSLQFSRIHPANPRALYFNDDVYVGWVKGGRVLELIAVDPEQGAIFYTIPQVKTPQPQVKRARGECMACHETPRTQRVPGFLVRSVFPKSSGHPDFRMGTETTDHRTKFADRFGGWYVTGSHGNMRHRGNVTTIDEPTTHLDREAGANQTKLPAFVNSDAYLKPTSDIVALMILEHQTQMHNRITKTSFSIRRALHDQHTMNEVLKRPADFRSDSTTRRLNSAVEQLLEYMFFSSEYQLTAPVKGTSQFAKDFMASDPVLKQRARDSKTTQDESAKRSLRDLDLQRRLMRYPCSYLIYSKSFQSLPLPALTRIKQRTLAILDGRDTSNKFAHLSKNDRQNILEILQATHPLFQANPAALKSESANEPPNAPDIKKN